jgi:hypothetical protein
MNLRRLRTSLAPWLVAASLGSACVGDIGDPNADQPYVPTTPQFEPGSATIYKLTQIQLQNSVRALFGEATVVPTDLPADDQLYGFSSIAAASATISTLDAEKYEAAAYAVLDPLFADAARRDALVGCAPQSMGDACVRSFLETFTERAWRRPVSTAEIDALIALGTGIESDLGASQGLKFTLAAVLQSPSFLFRVEVGEPTPGTPGLSRYTSWEMASRLSYLITDGPPDDELLEAARNGELTDDALLEVQARRLVDDPRARPAMVRFFRDFMQIRNLDKLDKNPDDFPQFSATLGPSMRVEIERMFENVVFEEERDFRSLFTTRETYLNEELARVYGIEGITGSDWVPVTLPDDGKRGGILTTAGFLAMNAQKTRTSPTHRGRFVRVNLLCDDIPPPPPGVDTTLPDPAPGQQTTLRQRLEQHREDPTCAACHEKMDPLGFAFEGYDAIGAFRTEEESGLPVDTATDLDGEPVANGIEMGQLVGELPEVGACVARRFYEHAGAHLAGKGEDVAVEDLVTSFVNSNYDFKTLIVSMVTNEGFRYAVPEGSN